MVVRQECFLRTKSLGVGPLVLSLVFLLCSPTSWAQNKIVVKEKEGFCFELQDTSGNPSIPAAQSDGILINQARVIAVVSQGNDVFQLQNAVGDRVEVRFTIETHYAKVEVFPKTNTIQSVTLRVKRGSYAMGLGDVAAFKSHMNLIENPENSYSIENDGGGKRWVTSFVVFPAEGYAGAFFDKGNKRVDFKDGHYAMTAEKGKEGLCFYYFFGSPKEMYTAFAQIKSKYGFAPVKPKARLFELGWESWDALGWNTNQETVKDILQTFLKEGYPIKWAITGSGFWDQGGTTTSFGRWGKKFPNAVDFKHWMNQNDIAWMIGQRTNFIPEGGPYYPKTKKRDKNLKVNSFYGNALTTEAQDKGYLWLNEAGLPNQLTSGVFPIVPSVLLDGSMPGASEWFAKQYALWGVDGVKEDTMMKLGENTHLFNGPMVQLAQEGALVMARNGEIASPGTLQRINDTGVGEMAKRIPMNYLQYAASGVPNVYSDVAGVHNMHKLDQIDKNIRHAWLLAVTPGMAVGAFPQKWPMEKQQVFKKTTQFHHQIAPYLYHAAYQTYETGYPYTLTPLPLAYPKDEKAQDFALHQWLLGRSLLATPLLEDMDSESRNIYLPKGLWYDFESGQRFEGGKVYENQKVPLNKVPLFVGGQGILVLRKGDGLYARVYPMGEKKEEDIHLDGQESVFIKVNTSKNALRRVKDSNKEKIEFKKIGPAIEFKISSGNIYRIK